MKKKVKNRKQILYLAIFVIVGIAFVAIFIAKPENDGIKEEQKRLQQVEEQLIEAINMKDYERAKIQLIQMRWQYVPSTIGGESKTDELKKIWDQKRIEYFIAIGVDPDEFIMKEEKSSLEQKWDDFINN